MASEVENGGWEEKFGGLALNEGATPPCGVQSKAINQIEVANDGPQGSGAFGPEGRYADDKHEQMEPLDLALRQALTDSKERMNVLRIESVVERFLVERTKDTLEFPSEYTKYQRLLAHKIAQYYGLQTSTMGYEEGQGRVVARRTEWTQYAKTRLGDLDIRPPTGRPLAERGGPKMLIKRPSTDDVSRSGTPGMEYANNQSPLKTAQEREEDYNLARERILGKSLGEGNGGSRQQGGRGAASSRGTLNGRGGSGRVEGGRGRKAVLRDRDRELQDPDYKRGVNRYQQMGFDPNCAPMTHMYSLPAYATEFPQLGGPVGVGPASSTSFPVDMYGWSGGGHRHRPPPPPPPGGPPPQHKPYPTGPGGLPLHRPYPPMPLATYPLAPMGMAFAPGMPGMGPTPYGPIPLGFPVPPGSYGFMPPQYGQEGMPLGPPFPMYLPPNMPGYPSLPAFPPFGQAPTPSSRGLGTFNPDHPIYERGHHRGGGGHNSKGTGGSSGPASGHQELVSAPTITEVEDDELPPSSKEGLAGPPDAPEVTD